MLSLNFSKCYLSWRYVEWSSLFEVKKQFVLKVCIFLFFINPQTTAKSVISVILMYINRCFFKCFLQVFLINCSRLVNQKDPMFRTQSSKLCKIFVKYIVRDHICRPSFMRKWSANVHKCTQGWWSSWCH